MCIRDSLDDYHITRVFSADTNLMIGVRGGTSSQVTVLEDTVVEKTGGYLIAEVEFGSRTSGEQVTKAGLSRIRVCAYHLTTLPARITWVRSRTL